MKKTTLFFVGIMVFISILGWYGYVQIFSIHHAPEDTFFVIRSGENLDKIAQNLEDQGLISQKWLLKLYAKLRNIDTNVKSGSYAIPTTYAPSDLLLLFSEGKETPDEVELTFLEGWTNEDMAAYAEQQDIASSQEFLQVAQNAEMFRDDFMFLSDENIRTLEGYLFPDTYKVFRNASAEQLVRKMLENFGVQVLKLKDDISKTDQSLHDTVIMASILEKEVRTYGSKTKVAGILSNRLKDHMLLQVDASINYITKKNNVRSTLADLEIDSPYNTYKYFGLPIGPLGNPGLDSLKAALNPEKNDYFFYLTDASGNIYFAESYEQHLMNKRKYLTDVPLGQ
ncbi:MAG: endolytic transglycosylase MltG [Parcubacteria group bacterium]|nr:endolytic transglycosylase MltG [Parcubacteria group bacterium]